MTPKRRIPEGCVYWFTVTTTWSDFDIVFADSNRVDELKDWFGYCDTDQGIIFLNRSLARDPRRLAHVTLHEITHGAVSSPGETRVLSRIVGCKEAEADDREEDILVHFVGKLTDSLLRANMIILPPLPKELLDEV